MGLFAKPNGKAKMLQSRPSRVNQRGKPLSLRYCSSGPYGFLSAWHIKWAWLVVNLKWCNWFHSVTMSSVVSEQSCEKTEYMQMRLYITLPLYLQLRQLSRVNHPNIVKLYGSCHSPVSYYYYLLFLTAVFMIKLINKSVCHCSNACFICLVESVSF